MRYLSVQEILFYNKIWLNRIMFYQRETDMYVENITSIVSKNKIHEHLRDLIAAEMNLSTKSREMQQFREHINQLEHKLEDYRSYHLFADDHQYVETFFNLKERFKDFQKAYLKSVKKVDKVLANYIKLEEV
ncbi:hypothetical protein [Chondrinema litorale]|uniref:hypothetical protein n=1 Tax=Chondrinema litorale TaxID=2994555 RepID=UPI002543D20F|nr:hypothetical protein [Chondrinema litorale]UZR94153.1 hypothetical protein OQ292_20140 [Chondrinema litorale]